MNYCIDFKIVKQKGTEIISYLYSQADAHPLLHVTSFMKLEHKSRQPTSKNNSNSIRYYWHFYSTIFPWSKILPSYPWQFAVLVSYTLSRASKIVFIQNKKLTLNLS